jgi:oxygen-dependent protoporphyrinogen oxidase
MEGAPRVLVVGAGVAGLGAAWRLARRGFDVTVCERRARPGGRAASEPAGDFTLDRGWSVLSSADRELLTWIDEVGVRDELLPLRPVVVAQAYRGRVREIDARGMLGVARIPGVRLHEAARLLRLPRLFGRYARAIDPYTPERAAELDDRSLTDFARLYFGRSVLEHWMAPLAAAPSLADADEVSRVLFLQRYRRWGDGRPGLPRAPFAELPEAAAAKLKVLYEAEVVRLERPSRGAIQATVERPGRGVRIYETDVAVVAGSAPDAARVADPLLVAVERDFFAGTRYAAGLSLAVALRRPLHPHPQQISIPHAQGSALSTVLLEPGVRGGRVPDGRGLAMLRALGHWAEVNFGAPDEAIEEELLGAFADSCPGVRGAVLFARVLRTPRAHPRFDVGRYRALARFERAQSELRRAGRRIYFAGDYLMDPSWEGALASARRVDEAVANDLSPA